MGDPVIRALAINVLLAVYTLVPRMDKHTTARASGRGGFAKAPGLSYWSNWRRVGRDLRDSGAGAAAEQVANLPISPILIRLSWRRWYAYSRIGDGEAMPPRFPRRSGADPRHQYVACRSGRNDGVASSADYFNDSLFWVVNRMMGVS